MEAKFLVLIILSITRILQILIGTIFYIRERRLKIFGIETQTKVVKMENLGFKYRPILEYQTESGKVTVKNKTSSSKIFFPFNEGDTINIYYDSKNVKRYRFEKDRIWKFIIAMLLFGGIYFFIVCVLVYFIM